MRSRPANDEDDRPDRASFRRCRSPDGTGTGDHPAARRRRAGRARHPAAGPARTDHPEHHRRPFLPHPHRDGYSQWHYEPGTGPATDPATLTAIITHILKAPHAAGTSPDADAYRAFPLKGIVGRCLQDRGLTVTLQVSEDLESFEATTDIEVTSPARPWLGLIRLSDNGHLEWDCDYRTAFHGDPGTLDRRDRPHPARRHRHLDISRDRPACCRTPVARSGPRPLIPHRLPENCRWLPGNDRSCPAGSAPG